MILLDTSVLSRVFRRARLGPEERRLHAVFQTLMESDEPVGLPAIVLQEVLSGMRTQRQFSELSAKLVTAFTVLPASVQDHLAAAKVKSSCARSGLNVSGIDCLIAATAIEGKHELFTTDGDFDAIAKVVPLRLFAWGEPG